MALFNEGLEVDAGNRPVQRQSVIRFTLRLLSVSTSRP